MSATLTKREAEVLHLLATGLSNKAIGEQLCVAEHTVEHHLKHIYRKLGVKKRVEATNVYWQLKITGTRD